MNWYKQTMYDMFTPNQWDSFYKVFREKTLKELGREPTTEEVMEAYLEQELSRAEEKENQNKEGLY